MFYGAEMDTSLRPSLHDGLITSSSIHVIEYNNYMFILAIICPKPGCTSIFTYSLENGNDLSLACGKFSLNALRYFSQ